MSGTRTLSPLAGASVDPVPLLGSRGGDDGGRRPSRRLSLRGAARFLRRASSRRLMREPSLLVRESAAEHLEERQSDWAYSRPVVFLDSLWNLVFVGVAAGVLIMSWDESPKMPLRLWIVGYALQCLVHAICVCWEYRRRHMLQQLTLGSGYGRNGSHGSRSWGSSGPSSPRDLEEGGRGGGNYNSGLSQDEDAISIARRIESANTMLSFIWWVIGFYWVSSGGPDLTRDAPQLYWLCIVFLAFDVFFVVFCVALACIVGIAMCCCLPCIIAVLYAVTDQEGASEEDICRLPKFKFRRTEDSEKSGETAVSHGGIMTEYGDHHNEVILSSDDAECCICLSAYDDGVEIRQLPCVHHFHSACVDKWLHINASCPLCKYNIIKSSNNSREEA
ncbi:hypothetical protein HPP92_006874 [Vanilla planifolia]|uniref:RING-type E3 ubiquitin transferase n=1 Tax=Vanilla planifolia TaxID=51239 RepID=A0A835RCY9_VANPL|nr:hypothetical protein HPP92_006874 [Vanilla planifolia]